MIALTDPTYQYHVFLVIIIYMRKLLDSDWLRAVQFECDTTAKSVIQCKKCNTSTNYTS